MHRYPCIDIQYFSASQDKQNRFLEIEELKINKFVRRHLVRLEGNEDGNEDGEGAANNISHDEATA